MPGRDGTGPNGQGSVTGRGMGNCDNNNANPKNGAAVGKGLGLGRRGCGRARVGNSTRRGAGRGFGIRRIDD